MRLLSTLPPAFTSLLNILHGAAKSTPVWVALLLMCACFPATKLLGEAAHTRTTLEVSPGRDRNALEAVTLTATVTTGDKPVSPGIVTFCDASARFCEDFAVLGTAAVTSNGTASLKKVFSPGSHRVYALFNRTQTNAGSRSEPREFNAGASLPSTTSVTASSGDPETVEATVTSTGVSPLEGLVALNHEDFRRAQIAPLRDSTLTASFAPIAFYESVPTITYPLGGQPVTEVQNMAVGDLNGDGLPDVVMSVLSGFAEEEQSFMTILFNDAAHPGQFLPGPIIDLPYVYSITVGDFNGDGSLDILAGAFAPYSNGYHLYLLSGDPAHPGQFAAPVVVGNMPNIITAADVNQDGVLDLIGLTTNGVFVLFGDPTHPGQFVNTTTIPSGDGTSQLAVADLNGDGVPDLVVANDAYLDSHISVLLGDRDNPGHFLAPVSYLSGIDYPTSFGIGDFNHDGLLDLAVSLQSGDALQSAYVDVLLNDPASPGQFQPPVSYSTDFPLGWAAPLVVGAFYGKDQPDLALRNASGVPQGGELEILPADPSHPGEFLTAVDISLPNGPDYAEIAAVADFNADGLTDLSFAYLPGGDVPYEYTVKLGALLTQATQTATVQFRHVRDGRNESPRVYARYFGDRNHEGSRSSIIDLGSPNP